MQQIEDQNVREIPDELHDIIHHNLHILETNGFFDGGRKFTTDDIACLYPNYQAASDAMTELAMFGFAEIVDKTENNNAVWTLNS